MPTIPCEAIDNNTIVLEEVITNTVVRKGYSPYIGANGNWWEYDDVQKKFIDTGVHAGELVYTAGRHITIGTGHSINVDLFGGNGTQIDSNGNINITDPRLKIVNTSHTYQALTTWFESGLILIMNINNHYCFGARVDNVFYFEQVGSEYKKVRTCPNTGWTAETTVPVGIVKSVAGKTGTVTLNGGDVNTTIGGSTVTQQAFNESTNTAITNLNTTVGNHTTQIQSLQSGKMDKVIDVTTAQIQTMMTNATIVSGQQYRWTDYTPEDLSASGIVSETSSCFNLVLTGRTSYQFYKEAFCEPKNANDTGILSYSVDIEFTMLADSFAYSVLRMYYIGNNGYKASAPIDFLNHKWSIYFDNTKGFATLNPSAFQGWGYDFSYSVYTKGFNFGNHYVMTLNGDAHSTAKKFVFPNNHGTIIGESSCIIAYSGSVFDSCMDNAVGIINQVWQTPNSYYKMCNIIVESGGFNNCVNTYSCTIGGSYNNINNTTGSHYYGSNNTAVYNNASTVYGNNNNINSINVGIGTSSTLSNNNTIGSGCDNITIGGGSHRNSIGRDCKNITIGANVLNSDVDDGSYNDTINANCERISLGSYVNSCTVGSNCYDVKYESNVSSCNVSNGCSNVLFESGYRNTTAPASTTNKTYPKRNGGQGAIYQAGTALDLNATTNTFSVKYDDNTIKVNSSGQLYATGGGGGNVQSVNGKVGTVVLDHTDVGAVAFKDEYISNANTYYSVNGYSKTSTSTTNLPSVCTGYDRWGVIFFIAENIEGHTGTQMYFPIDGTYAGRIFYRSMVRGTPNEWKLMPFETTVTQTLTTGTQIGAVNGTNLYAPTPVVYTAGDRITINNNAISASPALFLVEYGVTTYAQIRQAYDVERRFPVLLLESDVPTTIDMFVMCEDSNYGITFQCAKAAGNRLAAVSTGNVWTNNFYSFPHTLNGKVASDSGVLTLNSNDIRTNANQTLEEAFTALALAKQDKLTAGSGIAINNNVISATGSGGAEYHAGTGLSLDQPTNTFSVDYTATQAKLTAGEGIAIENNVVRNTLMSMELTEDNITLVHQGVVNKKSDNEKEEDVGTAFYTSGNSVNDQLTWESGTILFDLGEHESGSGLYQFMISFQTVDEYLEESGKVAEDWWDWSEAEHGDYDQMELSIVNGVLTNTFINTTTSTRDIAYTKNVTDLIVHYAGFLHNCQEASIESASGRIVDLVYGLPYDHRLDNAFDEAGFVKVGKKKIPLVDINNANKHQLEVSDISYIYNEQEGTTTYYDYYRKDYALLCSDERSYTYIPINIDTGHSATMWRMGMYNCDSEQFYPLEMGYYDEEAEGAELIDSIIFSAEWDDDNDGFTCKWIMKNISQKVIYESEVWTGMANSGGYGIFFSAETKLDYPMSLFAPFTEEPQGVFFKYRASEQDSSSSADYYRDILVRTEFDEKSQMDYTLIGESYNISNGGSDGNHMLTNGSLLLRCGNISHKAGTWTCYAMTGNGYATDLEVVEENDVYLTDIYFTRDISGVRITMYKNDENEPFVTSYAYMNREQVCSFVIKYTGDGVWSLGDLFDNNASWFTGVYEKIYDSAIATSDIYGAVKYDNHTISVNDGGQLYATGEFDDHVSIGGKSDSDNPWFGLSHSTYDEQTSTWVSKSVGMVSDSIDIGTSSNAEIEYQPFMRVFSSVEGEGETVYNSITITDKEITIGNTTINEQQLIALLELIENKGE